MLGEYEMSVWHNFKLYLLIKLQKHTVANIYDTTEIVFL